MYIWKINKLEQQLIAGRLPESETFKYLMVNIILLSLVTIPYGYANSYDSWIGIIGFITAVSGLWIIYKCNGGKNGKHIIERYLAVGWVVSVRLFVLFLLPAIITIMVIQEFYLGGIAAETTQLQVVLTILIELIYYLWFAKHILYIARQPQEK
ncbi:MAG: hypothetical protein KAQ67_06875 [Gammaproteobacteria bacterium]|nr:hypothetical protein [Gammaproteobacteria bacterium]